jgi:hypothetical protein
MYLFIIKNIILIDFLNMKSNFILNLKLNYTIFYSNLLHKFIKL